MQVSLGDVGHSNTEEFRFLKGRDGHTDFLVVAECSLRSRKSFQIALDGSVTHDFQIPVSIHVHGLGKFDVVIGSVSLICLPNSNCAKQAEPEARYVEGWIHDLS